MSVVEGVAHSPCNNEWRTAGEGSLWSTGERENNNDVLVV